LPVRLPKAQLHIYGGIFNFRLKILSSFTI